MNIAALVACARGPNVWLSDSDAHAVTVQAPNKVKVTCTAEGDERSATIDGEGSVRGLLADTTYGCSFDGETQAVVTTTPLPSDLPLGEVEVADAAAGWHLVNLHGIDAPEGSNIGKYLVIVDEEGRPRWQFEGVGGADVDATWLGDGGILYAGGNSSDTNLPPTIIDLDGDQHCQADDASGSEYVLPNAWNHDAGFDQADPSRIWALARESVAGIDGFVVLGIDAESGESTWTWASTEHGEALPEPEDGEDDPFHANAIWDQVENRETALYLSLRRVSRVERVVYETGAVTWSLGYGGDFALLEADGTTAADDRWFFGQHDVKRIGDRVTLFDNGTLRPDGLGDERSRVLELELDETARTARIVFEWTLPLEEEDWIAYLWGGVDPRDEGGYCVAASHYLVTNPDNAPTQLLHVEAGGELSWQVTFADGVVLYRSQELATFP